MPKRARNKPRKVHRNPIPAAPSGPPLAGCAYTEAETAAFLRLRNPRTLAVWRCCGRHKELKCSTATGRALYLGESILAFMAEGKGR